MYVVNILLVFNCDMIKATLKCENCSVTLEGNTNTGLEHDVSHSPHFRKSSISGKFVGRKEAQEYKIKMIVDVIV